VFNRINLHNPENAWTEFEQISGLVKRTNFELNKVKEEKDVNNAAGVFSNAAALNMIEEAISFIKADSLPRDPN